MKKRIISLLLVVAMLLCVLPAASAAENEGPAFSSYYLSLNKSIAINFKLSNYDGQNFDKVVFEKDGKAVQTITKLPAAGTDGKYVFTFTKLSPAELGKTITAKLYLTTGDTAVAEKTKSALQYCNTILAGEYSDNLKNLVVDLLNFGAEFQEYKGITEGLVNANLGENTKWATIATPALVSDTVDNTNGAITKAGLALNDSVEIIFVAADNVAKLEVTVGDKGPYTVTASSENGWFYFDKLNPAQMREKVVVQAYDSSNVPVGGTLTYSIVSYANDPDPSAADVTLAMMKYGDAAAGYVAASASDVLYYNNFNYAASHLDLLSQSEGWSADINDDGQLQIDVAATDANYITLGFAKSDCKKISVEWDYMISWSDPGKACTAGINFYANDGTKDLSTLVVVARGGHFMTNDAWSSANRCTMEPNRLYKLKVEFDLTNTTFDFIVDGKTICDNRPLKGSNLKYLKYGLIDIKENAADTTTNVYFDNIIVKEIN